MSLRIVHFLLPLLLVYGCADKSKPAFAPVIPVTDNYFGLSIEDPYRYMENMDDTLFLGWMKEYANYSRSVLDEIPGREDLLDIMKDFDSRKADIVHWPHVMENGRYIYSKISAGEEKSKIYYRNGFEGEEKLVYDPDWYSQDETMSYTLSAYNSDWKGERLAVTLSANGSENGELVIVNVEDQKLYDEVLAQVFSDVSWLEDNTGFIYTKTNSVDVHDPGRYQDMKVYHHVLGTSQSEDRIIFSSSLYPEIGMSQEEIPVIVYDIDSKDYYLILYTVENYLKCFRAEGNPGSLKKRFNWKTLAVPEDKVEEFFPVGEDLYVLSSKDAPGYRILRTSGDSPDYANAEVIVDEPASGIIAGFNFSKEAMFYKVRINGVEEHLYKMEMGETEASEVELPVKAGEIKISTRGLQFSDVWIGIAGWMQDVKRYRYNMKEDSFSLEELSSEVEYPEYDDLVVEEIMVPSHDGVMVPLSIMYKKDTPLEGKAPVMIYGYGAYGSSISPYFSPYRLIWTLKGGIYAVAHVRGGGELGDAWKMAGHKTTKPNTWKDLIACAEYLAENNYTSKGHIAIMGGSAGGILIGRAITERPDLFSAAISIVGKMNPLRSEESPNGPVNAPEYGTVKDSVECMGLIEMDSYLSIEDGVNYPATLITAGFNDPRVIVWQPAKFAARMQAANASKNPILFDVDYSAGHGMGDTKTKSFEKMADYYAFALWQTGHEEFDGK